MELIRGQQTSHDFWGWLNCSPLHAGAGQSMFFFRGRDKQWRPERGASRRSAEGRGLGRMRPHSVGAREQKMFENLHANLYILVHFWRRWLIVFGGGGRKDTLVPVFFVGTTPSNSPLPPGGSTLLLTVDVNSRGRSELLEHKADRKNTKPPGL